MTLSIDKFYCTRCNDPISTDDFCKYCEIHVRRWQVEQCRAELATAKEERQEAESACADLMELNDRLTAEVARLTSDLDDLSMDAKRLADSTLGLAVSTHNHKLCNARKLVYEVLDRQQIKE